ncbi:MAG: creatininase family protein [Segetibacter sp.]
MAIIAILLLLGTFNLFAQELHTRWDEITASEWPKALKASNETCILPIGILEKHGPHVPVGSDLIQVREWSARATKKEYAVVFPDFFMVRLMKQGISPEHFHYRHVLSGICWRLRVMKLQETVLKRLLL